ncbi:peptidoglycan-binding protein [Chania multitudinisentens RB-25]|uniref:Peptidoglycan-binding protein n=1 Tax=Chania multitudinisentens RB-25 TaxID=1441930 RepID=W0LG54_9GAMM|nr:N-acetylmuramidase family protein [Chania multitudinisentens]AHG21267.2 peptidoglycan-binding protein [Chania multitudinisentens RB-25]
MSNLIFQDYQRVVELLGVPGAVVQAVAEVESAGAGMLPDGRPKILFERHVFRRLLLEKGVKVDGLPADLVNRVAGGYSSGAAEHDRLARAVEIERECALQSCSWGAFQIMGYHWNLLKYPNLQAFINAMYNSEADQLEAFVRFINANSALVKALRALDWAAFAKGYNGAGYASNNYDKKMAAAFSRAGG